MYVLIWPNENNNKPFFGGFKEVHFHLYFHSLKLFLLLNLQLIFSAPSPIHTSPTQHTTFYWKHIFHLLSPLFFSVPPPLPYITLSQDLWIHVYWVLSHKSAEIHHWRYHSVLKIYIYYIFLKLSSIYNNHCQFTRCLKSKKIKKLAV